MQTSIARAADNTILENVDTTMFASHGVRGGNHQAYIFACVFLRHKVRNLGRHMTALLASKDLIDIVRAFRTQNEFGKRKPCLVNYK